MKKFILALVFILLSSTMFENSRTVANANDTLFETPVCLTVNGNYIKSDTPGYLEGGYTMVPIRAVTEALRADRIDWNEKSSTATITRKNTTIVLKKNNKTAVVNGKNVTMDTASVIKADRFYVPVRFVAETLSTKVGWNASTYTVNITAQGVTVPASMIEDRGYTDNDIYWLSRIVNAESQGEPMIGKIAVANVVLNRVKSSLFANNIYDVIFDRNYGVQFTPILNGTIYNTPLGDSVVAAKRALRGENYASESLYFLNPRIATSSWIINNRTFFRRIGNHDFYL
ncbi:MAG TPA: copper amine oxidase [Clostridiales bacterium]|jgi:N-acetylmuramoyl-L-alanine amidase|nr:copper amine oxidase [Clostridiales bacterium]HBL81703.1 copper amine oxidase [Clostridiales bacterium]